jgi:myo-inositol-1(or 4)-monophosphatase
MKNGLSPDDGEIDDFALLKDAAEAAGALALTFWRRRIDWKRKPDGTVVTEADLAVNELVAEQLRAARPDYGWLSEESADDPARLKRRKVWIVDPIDGTHGFFDGGEDWTIALALVEDGAPVLSAVFNPAREELFLAQRHGGATLNGEPISVSQTASLENATLMASDGVLRKPIWKKPWPPMKVLKLNSIAYRLAYVACGRADAIFTIKPKSEWDVAAGTLLVQEAAGCATSADGRPLRFNKPKPLVPGFLAAGKILHEALAERLTLGLNEASSVTR